MRGYYCVACTVSGPGLVAVPAIAEIDVGMDGQAAISLETPDGRSLICLPKDAGRPCGTDGTYEASIPSSGPTQREIDLDLRTQFRLCGWEVHAS